MKALKDNYLVKTVYAYLDLFYKVFPFFFILFYAWQLIIPSKGADLSSYDALGFFKFLDSLKLHNVSFEVTTPLKFLAIAINILAAAGIFIALKKLTKFIKNTFDGNPFSEDNGKNLKFVGVLLTLFMVVWAVVVSVAVTLLQTRIGGGKIIVLAQIGSLLTILFHPFFVLALFVIVLGEIIIHGAKIKQENDLTV